MFTENVKYPDTFMEARELLENCLNDNSRIFFKAYDDWQTRPCEVVNFYIEEVEDESVDSNLTLSLTYNLPIISEQGENQIVEKTKKLRLLSARGDTKWTYRLITKIWEGKYPSTVAVDIETQDVYFLNITMHGVDLIQFGVLDEQQFEAFANEINDRYPFRIKVAEQALMNFIDGAQGIQHIRDNMIIELNCGIPLDVKLNLPKHQTHN